MTNNETTKKPNSNKKLSDVEVKKLQGQTKQKQNKIVKK
jgi:hypothetical protein